MIKQNRRVPGTINSTPINRGRTTVSNENQASSYELSPSQLQTQSYEQTNDKQATLKYRQKQQKSDDSSLIELNMEQRSIEDVEKVIDPAFKFHLISVLNLSSNFVTAFPATIFNKLANLTKLYLNNNKIDKISFPYFKQNKLKIVDISCNSLKSINLEHMDSLILLNCSRNEVSFLTLPESLQFLDCSANKLSNIYFMEQCDLLEEVSMADNLLYDLKFNFKPYIRLKEEPQSKKIQKYRHLHFLDCSHNKIIHIEGMEYLPAIKVLNLSHNSIAITRHILNQLLQLQNLENLNLFANPIQSSGFTQEQIIDSIVARLPNLITFNDEQIGQQNEQQEEKCFSTERKSHFSGINEEPYQLFMESHRKTQAKERSFENMEWNFTLGDCEHEGRETQKISQLSQIEIVPHNSNQLTKDGAERYKIASAQSDLQQTYYYGVTKPREIKLKVLKSSTPLVSQHIFYQQFLNSLAPMSYIPTSTLLLGQDNVTGRRLDQQDDEYVLIDRMLSSKGGVSFLKKVSKWVVEQQGKAIFSKYSESHKPSLGFLLKDVKEQQFRELSKYNKLIRKTEKDIIGLQPNAFTYFHLIVRENPLEQYYQCVYLVETFQL